MVSSSPCSSDPARPRDELTPLEQAESMTCLLLLRNRAAEKVHAVSVKKSVLPPPQEAAVWVDPKRDSKSRRSNPTPPLDTCTCDERISSPPPACRERRESPVSSFAPNRVPMSIPKHLRPPWLPPPLVDKFLAECWRLEGPGGGVAIEPPDDVANKYSPRLGISTHSEIPGLATRLSPAQGC